ncbi:MAG: hypothetical protein HY996_09415 [Micrococcales bacterium]|nr:hypothetical protein [Micrococcales bacterium]
MTAALTPHILLTRDFLRAGDRKTMSTLSSRGEVVRIGHGAYVRTEQWERMDPDARFRSVIRAAAYLFPGAGPFSHRSAAVLLGLPSPDPWPRRAEVIAAPDGSVRAVTGLLRHLAPMPDEIVIVEGFPVTTLARTVVDVARTARPRVGLVMADHLLARDSSPGRQDLLRELERLAGSSGLRRARQIIEFADGRAGSPGETVSRLCFWTIGAPMPQLQVPFSDTFGLIGIVDFWWPEFGLIGEFDGRVKYQRSEFLAGRSAAEAVIDEKRREDRLRALGPRVLRWGWDEATNPELMRRILLGSGLPLVAPRASSRVLPQQRGSAA